VHTAGRCCAYFEIFKKLDQARNINAAGACAQLGGTFPMFCTAGLRHLLAPAGTAVLREMRNLVLVVNASMEHAAVLPMLAAVQLPVTFFFSILQDPVRVISSSW
jgi:hypothetical protein